MRLFRGMAVVAASILCGWAPRVAAETQKGFVVSAVIANGCSVTAGGNGDWGDIVLPTTPGVTTGTVEADLISGGGAGIQIDCTPGMTVNISADTGNQPSGGVRRLAISGDSTTPVPYLLYANGSTTPWTTQSIPLSFPVGTSHKLFPVHAKATLSGATKGGAYQDTVRITLSW